MLKPRPFTCLSEKKKNTFYQIVCGEVSSTDLNATMICHVYEANYAAKNTLHSS